MFVLFVRDEFKGDKFEMDRICFTKSIPKATLSPIF